MGKARDLLLEATAREGITPVFIPEVPKYDGKIFVRVMTAAERHLYGATLLHAREEGEFISDYETVAICACEEDGTPCFHSVDENGRIKISSEDVVKLRNLDGRVIHAIAKKALEVSGLDFEAKERAEKKSETPNADSSSG